MANPVVNFRAACDVASSILYYLWGIGEGRPSPCRNHGPRIRSPVSTARAKQYKGMIDKLLSCAVGLGVD